MDKEKSLGGKVSGENCVACSNLYPFPPAFSTFKVR